ncbi:plasmid replication protein RepC [Gemmobacter sp. LW-1]|uniref:plasmid replication protein RepC n=1 Tax=Gemmobacter sp. LW-1 TaxID=1529005 RepID=UPI0006C76C61|nr:plasmid replication protein RepC [Gemmobacter sp. LW-1]
MAFRHASAPIRSQADFSLSADNPIPDRFAMIEALRRAAPALGLRPPVIATLDTLLSCLPPKRNHNRVFASNATLALRRNGVSDRTLRRHFAELIEAGFLLRIDSPNGKRYCKHDPEMGTVLRFGLDLSPLFNAYERLCSLARQVADQQAHLDYLRTKLRSTIASCLAKQGETPLLEDARRVLRRKPSAEELGHWLSLLSAETLQAESEEPAEELSASNGQNVRHHHSSKKELIDKKAAETEPDTSVLSEITQICPQAASFLQTSIRNAADITSHARQMAPMMGIERQCYERAEDKRGAMEVALTIWLLLEMQDRIHQLGAYFRSVMLGARSETFCPWQLLEKLRKRGGHQRIVRGQQYARGGNPPVAAT